MNWVFIAIIALMTIPTIIGLDEMITSWRISRWYEKKDRQHKLIKKLKGELK